MASVGGGGGGGASSTSRPSQAAVSRVYSAFLASHCAACHACNGYYGPAFSQPLCAPCHAFLHANDLDHVWPALLSFRHPQSHSAAIAAGRNLAHCGTGASLNVCGLPPEVWLLVFSFLDDISLYAVGNVCRRWHHMVRGKISSDQWRTFTRQRWPLFRPLATVQDWFAAYSALMESCFCLTCKYQMEKEAVCAFPGNFPGSWRCGKLRRRRLRRELEGNYGSSIVALDSSKYHWQGSITGPAGSPYEGGIFYLHLKVPSTYPFFPPEVRFLTRIFHPNVSRHGDIGIDIFQKGKWTAGITIPMLLNSVQSLLTDPYCEVCMEPDIGRLYHEDRKMFDAVARSWTWKFAMHDVMPHELI